MKMKEFLKRIKDSDIIVMMILLLCAVFGIAGMETVSAVAPTYGDQILDENGVAIEGEISLTDASTKAPELISKHFVQEVINMDPYSYPTMSLMSANYHWKKKAQVKDHIIQVNRISTPPIQVTVNTAIEETATVQVLVDFGIANDIVGLHQTIIFPKIKGYKPDGETEDGYPLQCRVIGKDQATSRPILKPINGKKVGGVISLPAIEAGTAALRGSRIGTETQIRTEQFGILPTPTDYFVSKRLIEFGTTGWYDNSSKNIKWGDKEVKDVAMTEFLRTNAPTFWLGKQANQIFNEYKSNTPEMTLFPEGIMHQASRELDFNGTINTSAFMQMQKVAFNDNNSSNLKYFAMGDELSPKFQEYILDTPGLNVSLYRNEKLNINFSEIVYSGGKRIRFIDDPSLNDCGLNDKGFILDPKYAGLYSYGFRFLPLDGIKAQDRDVSGMVAIDESAYILSNPEANVVVTL